MSRSPNLTELKRFIEDLNQRDDHLMNGSTRLKAIEHFTSWLSRNKNISELEYADLIKFIRERELFYKFARSSKQENIRLEESAPTLNYHSEPESDNIQTYENVMSTGPASHGLKTTNFLSQLNDISFLKNSKFISYFQIISVIIVIIGMFIVWNTKEKTTVLSANTAYINPTTKGKVLDMKGVLKDKAGTLITDKTDVYFRLYDSKNATKPLYTGSCVGENGITPDIDGRFEVSIGRDCGMKEIPSQILTDSNSLYLGISVSNDTEMQPRQQIANVGFSANSNAVQGLTLGSQPNSLLYINQSGELLVESDNPSLRSLYESADFTISSAHSTIVQAADTGNIILQATQSGMIKLATGGTADSFSRLVITNEGNIGVGTLSPLATFDVHGDIAIHDGQLQLASYPSSPSPQGVGSMYFNTTAKTVYYYNGNDWQPISQGYFDQTDNGVFLKNNFQNFFIGGNSTASAQFGFIPSGSDNAQAFINGNILLKGVGRSIGTTNNAELRIGNNDTGTILFAPAGNNAMVITTNGNVGIGTVSPTDKVDIAGSMTVKGDIKIAGGNTIKPTYGPLSLAYNTGVNSWNTGITLQDFSGNVGIGTTNPQKKLEVNGTIRIDTTTLALGNDNALCHTGTGGPGSDVGDCPTAPADLAENYAAINADMGEIVAPVSIDGPYPAVTRATQSYQSNIIGIISSLPSMTFGKNIPDELNPQPVALAGRIPLKVSDISGAIELGDAVTTSPLPGIGMKSKQAGVIVAKSLEKFDGITPVSPQVQKLINEIEAEISQNKLGNTDSNKLKLQHVVDALKKPLPPHQGWIMVYANTSWYDPSIYIGKNGNIDSNQSETANVSEKTQGSPETQTGTITVDLNPLVQGTLNSLSSISSLFTQLLTAVNARIDTLVVTNTIVSPVIETGDIISTGSAQLNTVKTNTLTPLANDLTFDLSQHDASSEIHIKGLNNQTVSKFDSQGNATLSGQFTSNTLNTNSASIAGTLTSNSLNTNTLGVREATIEGTISAKNVHSDNIDQLQKNQDNLQNYAQEQAQRTYTATTDLANQINQVQQELAQLKTATLTNPSTYQDLKSDQNVTVNSIDVMQEANLYNAAISNSLTVGFMNIKDNAITSLDSELRLSALSQINLLDGAVTIARDGNITAEGIITAKKGIDTNIISPIAEADDLTIKLHSNTQLQIKNEKDTNVASIDASGAAQFNSIGLNTYQEATRPGAIIAAATNFNKNGIYAPAIETTQETAGNGVIPKDSNEVIIYNQEIKANSLIYLTSTSPDPSYALSVVKKEVCSDAISGCKPYFKVALSQSATHDITFNWLIIQ